MSPNAASPRPRSHRRGASHLSLVTDETPATPVIAVIASVKDDEGTGGRHAAPAPGPFVAGSATMRALIALGAILSAIGLSLGKAEALESVFIHDDGPAEAEPDVPVDNVDIVPVAPAAPVAEVPVQKTAAKTSTTTEAAAPARAKAVAAVAPKTEPGTWTPTVAPAETQTYTFTTPAPHGRHRGQADHDEDHNTYDGPTGRHRKNGHGHHGHHQNNRPKSRQDSTTRPTAKMKGNNGATGHDARLV
jgi:hypothetical protein